MQRILSSVLPVIRPSREELERELAFAEMLVAHIRNNAPSGCDVVLTGSMAKQTFLRDKRDIDIFVLFQRSTPREALEPFIKDIMAAAFPGIGYQMSYAEHPYSRFHFEGRRIDLVPAYKISKAAERISAVDRSVLHTKFVLSSLKKRQVDDVLLLKQFLRANSLYGAEIRIGGFSGYLCELLLIRYKTFPALIRAASRWRAGKPVFTDIKKYYKPKEAAGAAQKFGSPLIVIDPTDRNRNVAAAVRADNFARFIALCRSFLKKPSEKFFFRKSQSFEERVRKAKKGGALFMVSMPRPDIVDDILWGQLHKMINQLKAHLCDFNPKEFISDDSRHLVRLAIILGKDRLPKMMLVPGPPLDMKDHLSEFKKSHRGARFVMKKKRIFARKKRAIIGAEEAIRSFFHAYSRTDSHLAYPEEMVLLERV